MPSNKLTYFGYAFTADGNGVLGSSERLDGLSSTDGNLTTYYYCTHQLCSQQDKYIVRQSTCLYWNNFFPFEFRVVCCTILLVHCSRCNLCAVTVRPTAWPIPSINSKGNAKSVFLSSAPKSNCEIIRVFRVRAMQWSNCVCCTFRFDVYTF